MTSMSSTNWANQVKQELAGFDPKSLGKVGVLMGGVSDEREISLLSGQGVLAALNSKGVQATSFDPGVQHMTLLAQEKYDRVFIALHGRFGEDGTIQGLLEQYQLPYTGSGVLSSALAIDKNMTKQIWISRGLPTPKHCMLTPTSNFNEVVQKIGFPLIVKPASEGSSLGLSKVENLEQLKAAYSVAAKFDREVMAEECIVGEELTCPVVGDGQNIQALPVIRIIAPKNNYDYHNKYFSDDTQYICPTGLGDALENEVQQLVIESYKALGCRGWGRADVMLNAQGKPFLLEMNTSPGMTTHSLVPMAAKHAGISYEELVLWLTKNAKLSHALVGGRV